MAGVWRADEDGQSLADTVDDALMSMLLAVEPAAGETTSEYHNAVEAARDCIGAMATAPATLPTPDEWRLARATISGALPQPSRRAQAATREHAAASR